MNFLYLTLSALLALTNGVHVRRQLPISHHNRIPYQWLQLVFSFPSFREKQEAERSGNLIPTNAIPIDVQPHYYNKNRFRTFVTIPKFQDGIPYTLATISSEVGDLGPVLVPYPNYKAHNSNNGRNCDDIISAFRVAITECNQMWVIDSGSSSPDGQHCPPKLLLFDLNTDVEIHRFIFPSSLYTRGASLFITPIADVRDPPPRGSCRDTMIYVADVNYHGLVVYNYKQKKAWRVENRFMYPEPSHGLHSVTGDSFILMDGIFGMATDKKNLYFHPLASASEYKVDLNILDDSSLFENSAENKPESFIPLGTRSSACGATAMDSNNNMYCVTLDPIELIMWNTNTADYNKRNIRKLPINREELEFVSGMKVVRNNSGNEELWMMSNRFQKMATGTQDFNEINFRIVVRPLANLKNELVFSN